MKNDLRNWISQADAARIKGVSRQAISKLVSQGKVRTQQIGGRLFVYGPDFSKDFASRKSRRQPLETSNIEAILEFLSSASIEEKNLIFKKLRGEIPIHPLEKKLNVDAETILEAISRAPDLTLRGIRGIIAEAAFKTHIISPPPPPFRDTTPVGNFAFDYVLTDNFGDVRIQVKMQRLKAHRPMLACEAYKFLSQEMYVVETQKTRQGKNQAGENTRPYRFGEFDILAVSLHPSTNSWSEFIYTVSNWLLPNPKFPANLFKFQPVPLSPNEDWTDSLAQSISWLRSGVLKRIAGANPV